MLHRRLLQHVWLVNKLSTSRGLYDIRLPFWGSEEIGRNQTQGAVLSSQCTGIIRVKAKQTDGGGTKTAPFGPDEVLITLRCALCCTKQFELLSRLMQTSHVCG